ncbi:MAG: hypothetical protein JO212_05485 [Acetobacteraceae bacterium]|nr:hypothetical protein [Acetobacteraceae bacterium]
MDSKDLWLGLRLVLAFFAFIGMTSGAIGATLSDELSRLIGVPAAELIPNLPPRTDRLPGALFNPDSSILDIGSINDADLRSSGLSLRAALAPESFSSEAVWRWPFLSRYRDKFQISVEITGAASYAIKSISERLDDSESARELIDHGIQPILIDRVWQGYIQLIVSRKLGVSDNAWAEVINAVRHDMDPTSPTNRDACSDSELSIKEGQLGFALSVQWFDPVQQTCRSDPVVFAYSALRLGRPGSIGSNLSSPTRVLSGELGRLGTLPAEMPATTPRPWALATVSSGWYSLMATMNQPWNSISAATVEKSLSAYRPTFTRRLEAARERTLTREATLDFVRSVALEAKKRQARLLVLYYIGHMVTHDDDTLALLMGDATRGGGSAQSPDVFYSTGGNIADLGRAATAIRRKLQPPEGELQLGDLYDAAASGGVPFVLIVDGCLEAPKFAAFRDRLGLIIGPQQLLNVFVGPDSPENAISRFSDRLRHFPDGQPFLSSKNPVILGAAPGTVAYERENLAWEWGAPIGPLASYIATTVERSKFWPDRPSLAQLLNWSAENKRLGENNLKGTISWSDWSQFLSMRSTPP